MALHGLGDPASRSYSSRVVQGEPGTAGDVLDQQQFGGVEVPGWLERPSVMAPSTARMPRIGTTHAEWMPVVSNSSRWTAPPMPGAGRPL